MVCLWTNQISSLFNVIVPWTAGNTRSRTGQSLGPEALRLHRKTKPKKKEAACYFMPLHRIMGKVFCLTLIFVLNTRESCLVWRWKLIKGRQSKFSNKGGKYVLLKCSKQNEKNQEQGWIKAVIHLCVLFWTIEFWLGLCRVTVFPGRVTLDWEAVGEMGIRVWTPQLLQVQTQLSVTLRWLCECSSCSETISAGTVCYNLFFYLQTELLYCISDVNTDIMLSSKSASDYGFFLLSLLVVLI